MTDVVVLAAGLGRRLAAVTDLPKWLTPVNGSCPADAHLRAFEERAIDRVHVVVPPAADAIEAHLGPWRDRLDIDLIVNDHASDRNNWYSLLLGLEAWAQGAGSAVLVVNSDLFASPAWFAQLLRGITSTRRPAALAVDRGRGRSAEAMKVQLDVSGDHVVRIGKVGIDQPDGEYVGLARWSRPAAEELAVVLQQFVRDPARADHWYEHGIQGHLDEGASYAAVGVPTGDWVEIDDEQDLETARRLPVAGGPPT